MNTELSGPLKGIRVIEMAGIGPGPFTAMLLSDMGAEVLRIDRKTAGRGRDSDHFTQDRTDVTCRGRRSVTLDMKNPAAAEALLRLVENADAIIDVFRPGVMERLGVGPDVCLARNPRIVFGRMTGWGQTGPLAKVAGHDINYISLSGVQHSIGTRDAGPVPPLNLIGDYAGALGFAFGLLAAIIEAKNSGKGQVVDAAMTDVASLLMARVWGLRAKGEWVDERENNVLDGGSHFYGAFKCADGNYISLASIESQFYAELMDRANITDPQFKNQWSREDWPALREKMTAMFLTKTRDEWCEILEGSDVCFAPILDMGEAPDHPHNKEREAFVEIDGVVQPAPAPRFSRTPGRISGPPVLPGEHNDEAFADWGLTADEIARLNDAGAI